MKSLFTAALWISIAISETSSAKPLDLSGEWQAKKYLEWGIRDQKIAKIEKMILKPEHFGFMLFNPTQKLTIIIEKEAKARSAEVQKVEDAFQISKFEGKLKSDSPLVDPACDKVPYYKTHFMCHYSPQKEIPLVFSVYDLKSPSFDEERKLVQQRFTKNNLKDIAATVTTSNLDKSSGGTLILFAGEKHLLLNVTYYANPVTPDEALSMKCPTGNTCTATALLFERVSAAKK